MKPKQIKNTYLIAIIVSVVIVIFCLFYYFGLITINYIIWAIIIGLTALGIYSVKFIKSIKRHGGQIKITIWLISVLVIILAAMYIPIESFQTKGCIMRSGVSIETVRHDLIFGGSLNDVKNADQLIEGNMNPGLSGLCRTPKIHYLFII